VCFVAALTANNLFYRARAALGMTRSIWITASGVMVGSDMWTAHFIAMLAYEPGIPIGYSGAVEQQNSATGEISENVAAEGMKRRVSVLGDVAGAATATRSSAETVLLASRSLESAVAERRSEVESFLGQVAN
jgi:hypothetical protein